ncbi:Ig heavy chain Mem5-like [Poecile atricapillus]|uniref:Ig heavy chain Mem5-like n=1 Tax=Poecile atricapillus TaxID=48891 RepID=UPI002739BC65|nr:Ig heavy chain Mem5-like [Poecile atricapillus]XP_058713794.1 Ig heavy chain Mem5-like [Poecile atricapillus]
MAAALGPWLLPLALALWPPGLWAQPRLQEAGGGLRAPGDSVTLSCRGSGFTFRNSGIWWYRQVPGGSLEWLSFISSPSGTTEKYGAAVNGRAKISRDNSRSEAHVSLRSLQVQDSARYFCAVPRWRSCGIDKLLFGPGTTLTVVPNTPKTSLPQVIVMKSRKLKEGGSTGKAACLARNFLTKNISLEMPATEVIYEQSTSILTSEGLYNAIKVVNVTQDTEVTCTAKFANSTITSQPATEEEDEEAVTEASKRVCNSTDTSAQDPEGQRVNMLSMAVLGLRVLLAKSIAFNALMSIKLFLF